MSRSRRKHPYIKLGRSDKRCKVVAHRKFRARERTCLFRLKSVTSVDGVFPKHMREVSNNWLFPSDGLAYYVSCPWEGVMRK